jgi:3-hydroxybutyryl-CoA dehydratase
LNKIKNILFDDIKIGQKSSFQVKITKEMVDIFAQLSGDLNPLHMDDEYAKKTQFGKRVCHGFLLSSLFSQLVGMYLPGMNSLYFSQSLNFKSPGYIEDEVTVEGKVIEKSPALNMVTMETQITNQDGKCLIDGLGKIIIRK